jgi:hypothetical protein
MGTIPYERTLHLDEIQRLWKQMQEHWDINGHGWYPITGSDMPPTVVAFEDAWFYNEIPLNVLQGILKRHEITRVWELREGHEAGYEMDTAFLDLYYDGTEGYWTSEGMDWLIYVSHENSLTVAGEWLIAAIKVLWPRWNEHLYTTYNFERPHA